MTGRVEEAADVESRNAQLAVDFVNDDDFTECRITVVLDVSGHREVVAARIEPVEHGARIVWAALHRDARQVVEDFTPGGDPRVVGDMHEAVIFRLLGFEAVEELLGVDLDGCTDLGGPGRERCQRRYVGEAQGQAYVLLAGPVGPHGLGIVVALPGVLGGVGISDDQPTPSLLGLRQIGPRGDLVERVVEAPHQGTESRQVGYDHQPWADLLDVQRVSDTADAGRNVGDGNTPSIGCPRHGQQRMQVRERISPRESYCITFLTSKLL
jgi:hypothetical protein